MSATSTTTTQTGAPAGAADPARSRPSDPAALAALTLSPPHRAMLEAHAAAALGDAAWRSRKVAEAHGLLALAQVAPPGRLKVADLDLETELRAIVELTVAVPMLPDAEGAIRTVPEATIMLRYPREITTQPVAGTMLARVFHPWFGVFHPNVGALPGQPMCYGVTVPAGLPLTELVLGAYSMLSLQNVMLDPGDAAGVMNGEAAYYFQQNQHLIPLERTPFFDAPRTLGRAPAPESRSC